MNDRFKALLREMNRGIYEKETEISLSLWAAVAGESIILLGPPGVAKSMIARRLKWAFKDARSFEYLMSRFSTPDEIFGPVSISRLKTDDAYVRNTEGYLPSADVVFLDEIWKAGPAIQNTLLTAINERLFRNGRHEQRLPLKLLVAASNELPAQGEGLEALWDRFIIRLESHNIKNDDNFDLMVTATSTETADYCPPEIAQWQITQEEYDSWRSEIDKVTIPAEVLQCLHQIKRSLHSVKVEGETEAHDVYVSDRRWKKIAHLMRTAAFMQGRSEVATSDLLPLQHCLWQEPEEHEGVRDMIMRIIFAPIRLQIDNMKGAIADELRSKRAAEAHRRASARTLQRDANKRLYNQFYYRIASAGNSHTYIVASDYQNLPATGKGSMPGVRYHDKKNPAVMIVRAYDSLKAMPLGTEQVTLARDTDHLYVDGVRFDIETTTVATDTSQPSSEQQFRDFYAELEDLITRLNGSIALLSANMLVTADDRSMIDSTRTRLQQEIAFMRVDIAKLYD